MPTLEYFIVARGAATDRFSNALTLFEVVEEITPRRFPVLALRFVVAGGWNISAEEVVLKNEHRVSIVTRIPGQDPTEMENTFVADSRRHRFLFTILGAPIGEPGEMEFELRIDGNAIAHHHILINAADPEAAPNGWLMYQPEFVTVEKENSPSETANVAAENPVT